MQSYVFKKMYSFLFSKKELQQKDEMLNNKILKIRETLTPHQLEIREDIDDNLISSAGVNILFLDCDYAEKELQNIDLANSPWEKLACILNCCKVLVMAIQQTGAMAGADDFLPVFMYLTTTTSFSRKFRYTVLRANVPHLHSHLSFIDRFTGNIFQLAVSVTCSAQEYRSNESFCFYTHLVCAVSYIEGLMQFFFPSDLLR